MFVDAFETESNNVGIVILYQDRLFNTTKELSYRFSMWWFVILHTQINIHKDQHKKDRSHRNQKQNPHPITVFGDSLSGLQTFVSPFGLQKPSLV